MTLSPSTSRPTDSSSYLPAGTPSRSAASTPRSATGSTSVPTGNGEASHTRVVTPGALPVVPSSGLRRKIISTVLKVDRSDRGRPQRNAQKP